MAIIEMREDDLRRAAGDEVFGQAAGQADKVTGLVIDGRVVSATVDGFPASARIGADGIVGECGCPAGGLCVHVTAAVLAWVRMGNDEDQADLFEVLREQDPDWLARQLAALAADDPGLESRLLAETVDGDALKDARDLRAELTELLDALEKDASDVARYEGPYGEWYPDDEGLNALLEEAGELVEDVPDEIRELTDYVITRIEGLLNYENCYGDGFSDALEEAQDLHLEACELGSPDVRVLAERLVTGSMASGWDVFRDAPAKYAHVLGAEGLARCRELLESMPSKQNGHDALCASLERAKEKI